MVRLTERGHAVGALMGVLLVEVEDEWREALGEERFAQLKDILQEVWESSLVRSERRGSRE